jgi:hypothetical protein
VTAAASRGPLAYLRGAAQGLLVIGRFLGRALLAAALIGAASAAAAAPAWLLASRHPRLFTAIALTLAGGTLAALLALRIRREARRVGGPLSWVRRRLLPAAWRLLLVIASLGALYAIALMLAAGLYAVAIPAAAALALIVGRRAYRASRRRRGAEAPPRADDTRDGDPP